MTANAWEDAVAYASKRPLLELKLVAKTASDAGALLACAQPFGAQILNLNIQLSGDLKEGGKINLKLTNVKHSNALKPIELSQKLARATTEYGQFQVELEFDFNTVSQVDTAAKFEQAQSSAPAGVLPVARFGLEN